MKLLFRNRKEKIKILTNSPKKTKIKTKKNAILNKQEFLIVLFFFLLFFVKAFPMTFLFI